MEVLGYIGIVLVTGAIVFLTSMYSIRHFLDQEKEKRHAEYRSQNQKMISPLRLQAYERIVLFLERINPDSLIMRLSVPGMQSLQLQREMLSLIRAEYEHNLSQQIYLSRDAWDIVCNAKENVIRLINSSAERVQPDSPSMDLVRSMMDEVLKMNPFPTRTAIDFIKSEVARQF